MNSQEEHLERISFASDPRNCEPAPTTIIVLLKHEKEMGDGYAMDVEQELPTKWVVCNICKGKGTHVNPAIDCGGLTAEDFNEDPEFAEDYMKGVYDQKCNRCEGRRVIAAPNFDKIFDTEERKRLRELYETQQEEEYEADLERLNEIRCGC